jgi:hypothetical protein
MSQLAQQLLNSDNLPIMGAMNQTSDLLNQVPMPQLLQNRSNMPNYYGNQKKYYTKSQRGNLQDSKK